MAKMGYHSAVINATSGGGKQATITVFDTETSDLATIYSDTSGTPGKSGTLVFKVTTSSGCIFVDELVISVEA